MNDEDSADRIVDLYSSLMREIDALDLSQLGKSKGEAEAVRVQSGNEIARHLWRVLANAGMDSTLLRRAGRINENRDGEERSVAEARKAQVGT